MPLRIISLVGTYGAGKTAIGLALTKALGQAGYSSDKVTYIVNEAGGVSTLSTNYARVMPLPNGCFTCQDDADLLRVLANQEQAGVEVVILEGFGLVSGEEVSQFLAATSYSYQLVAMLDVENLATNLLCYGEAMVASHLLPAAGVILTKVPSGVRLGDSQLHQVQQLLDQYATDTPVFVLEQGVPAWPSSLTTVALKYRSRFLTATQHHCGPLCTHHGHRTNHTHADASMVHGWRTLLVSLRSSVTVEDVQRVFCDPVADGAVRIKGVVAGYSFNAVPYTQNWQLQPSSDAPYLVAYVDESKRQFTEIPGVSEICEAVPATPMSHQLLRIDTGRQETVQEVVRLLALLDALSVQVTASGQLVTHPEMPLQLVKEMARRPAVKGEWFVPVIESCLRYWVRASVWWREQEGALTKGSRAVHARELGVSLAWWATEFAAVLPNNLVLEVRAQKPAVMVAEGILLLTALRKDPFWRHWQLEEYKRALSFGGDHTVAELELIAQAMRHLAALKDMVAEAA